MRTKHLASHEREGGVRGFVHIYHTGSRSHGAPGFILLGNPFLSFLVRRLTVTVAVTGR